jgi:REP element-mobilizing transposase RayT
LIDLTIAQHLARQLRLIALQERAAVLAVGIVSTHLHLLIRLHPTTTIPRLLQRMKGGTAAGVNGGGHLIGNGLRWAKGYSISSVSERALDRVGAYVSDQHRRHPAEAIPGWPDLATRG